MSGKIGYRKAEKLPEGWVRLNPFYVREDWLRSSGPSGAVPGRVLIPFMSGKIGYCREHRR